MPGPVNPDGTVQVPGMPPLVSAFAPQQGQPQPPPPQPQQAPPAPGFGQALVAMLQHLMGALDAHRERAPADTEAKITAASNGQDPNDPSNLANQLSPQK